MIRQMNFSESERIFIHFKGNRYKLISMAKHSETLEDMVVYQALYGEYGIWVRPASMFFGKTLVDGIEVDRFKEVLR